MIHPTAIISNEAHIGKNVKIGPYTFVDKNVFISDDCSLGAHCVITGNTLIGKKNKIFHHVSLGEIPQDKKYSNENTQLLIGDNNVIREFCTFNIGTEQDKSFTKIGSNNWIMAYVHIAHDCLVGDHVTIANCTQLAGHVEIDDFAILGGFTGIHQFCRIGKNVISGVGSVILADVPPYITVMGNTAKPYGINKEGLKRNKFNSDVILALKNAYKILYRSGLSLPQALGKIKETHGDLDEINYFIDFIKKSKRSIVR